MQDRPSYWTIRLGNGYTCEAFSAQRAREIYWQYCRDMPDENVELYEVWTRRIARRPGTTGE